MWSCDSLLAERCMVHFRRTKVEALGVITTKTKTNHESKQDSNTPYNSHVHNIYGGDVKAVSHVVKKVRLIYLTIMYPCTFCYPIN
jgi:hypothetical protein